MASRTPSFEKWPMDLLFSQVHLDFRVAGEAEYLYGVIETLLVS